MERLGDSRELIDRVLLEASVERRQHLYRDVGAGLDLVRALKAEVDRYKEADSAKALLAGRRAHELSEITPEPLARALGAWALALGLTVQGHFDEAMPHFEDARALYLLLDRQDEAARVSIRQVQALAMTGEYARALQLAEQTRAVLDTQGLTREAAITDNNMGIIYVRLGQFSQAENAIRRSLDGFARADDLLGVARAHVSLGRLAEQLDRFGKALEHFRTALEIFRELEQTRAVAGTLVNMALLYRREGRLGEALDLLTRVQSLYQQLEESADGSLAQLEEARVKLDLNLLHDAQTLAGKLVDFFRSRKMELERIEALTLLGEAQAKGGRHGEALLTLETARGGWHSIGNAVQAALIDLHIARLRLTQESTGADEALAITRAARETLLEHGLTSSVALSWLVEAEVRLASQQLTEAETCLDSVGQLPDASGMSDLAFRTAYLLGRTASQRGLASRAEQHYRDAIRQLESVRATLPVNEFKAAYMGDKLAVYGDLMQLLIGQGRTSEAFEVMERAKSRAQLDLILRGVDGRPPPADVRAGRLQRQLGEARQKLNWHVLKAEKESRPDWDEVCALEGEVSRLIQELERITPEAVAFERVQVPPFERVQRHLDAETALVTYFRRGDRVSAFVVGRGGARTVRDLGGVSDVQNDLDWISFYFERVAMGKVHTAIYGAGGLRERIDRHLHSLYERLIVPLELEPCWKRLIVVPDGPLFAVPFAALWDGDRYLIDRFQVTLSPSATTLLSCSARQSRGEGFLGFGITAEDTAGVGAEVREIATHFEDARVFLGSEASRAAFLDSASNAKIVHIATHGVFRPDNPMFSGVRFHDGWLTARDLYRLRLGATLVVLSACETGRFGPVYGDESFGFARGFLDIGVPTLVASLWPVKDRETKDFMTTFYTYLQQGLGVATALRDSQLAFRSSYPNPYHWAGFTVIGDPERAIIQPS